jgi:hypothetical protein
MLRHGLCPDCLDDCVDAAARAAIPVRTVPGRRWILKVDMAGSVPLHDPTLGPCWLWTGSINAEGYPLFRADPDTVVLAHRWAYARCYGDLPDGLQVDHECHWWEDCSGGPTCPHRRCVNPAHLSAATAQANNRRSGSPTATNARKTHCDAGHDLTDPENVYRHPRRGSRHCRTCQATRAAAWQARQRSAIVTARAAMPPGFCQGALL